jgi:hypothetical protein
MSSFTRTIPKDKQESFVTHILSLPDHFIPLTFQPRQAEPGDYIYLIHRGKIAGRAKISSIDAVNHNRQNKGEIYPNWAKWVVRYTGSWEKPPSVIHVKGHQGVRYLKTQGLGHLDKEIW